MKTVIRPYAEADFDVLLQLITQHIPEYFAVEEKADFEHYLLHEKEAYFVATIDEKIVACGGINYFPKNKEARISWDIVDQSQQGKGIGAALLQHRLNLIKRHSEIEKIIVRTTQLVYPFYQKNGFTLVKSEKDYWAIGFDLYLMQIVL